MGMNKLVISAADSISESRITKYEWDFSYDSADGFVSDEETPGPEVTQKFDSGLYTIKVRITNEMGESDEASYSDDIDLKINYDYILQEPLSRASKNTWSNYTAFLQDLLELL